MKATQKLSKNQAYVIDCLNNQHETMTYNVKDRRCFHAWTKYTNTIKSLVNMKLVEVVEFDIHGRIKWVALPENKNNN